MTAIASGCVRLRRRPPRRAPSAGGRHRGEAWSSGSGGAGSGRPAAPPRASGRPRRRSSLMYSTSSTPFDTTIPTIMMMPMNEVVERVGSGQEERPEHADEAHRHREHDHERVLQRAELRGEDHVDEHDGEDRHEVEAAERLPLLFRLAAEAAREKPAGSGQRRSSPSSRPRSTRGRARPRSPRPGSAAAGTSARSRPGPTTVSMSARWRAASGRPCRR